MFINLFFLRDHFIDMLLCCNTDRYRSKQSEYVFYERGENPSGSGAQRNSYMQHHDSYSTATVAVRVITI